MVCQVTASIDRIGEQLSSLAADLRAHRSETRENRIAVQLEIKEVRGMVTTLDRWRNDCEPFYIDPPAGRD